ncbi:TIGR00730 family Rossman fold protein [Leptospira sp. 2 VSF19]|uniref:Cytokinin riboside 5'-monophosphate phosphoribohydrolase n=1 Tax=Leptospira soteropolitanensis TaxID=2950025 RepID=A0AAW5VF78_9LEPT|nr:TIGR00730 family Rossman fold protein [Leptospira soteropolitanensis]MCW7493856.1 TIGR00730 family Rossman fold protein [Leptospira soteropolitanensis]MCW7501451.1 TIGR00730 family Rossman fold protein [Leptospira soteropolitanensis]MCW7523786.1 TIGR00730 family Rossman fold protein [Leptospira soteropolitanensis]MCW7527651.1 TIGR00730 family Rossman fold protein [Leptospira soteropolitanensis]MCW7531504.1 TIGR00730 family Rossman fold protein [Leptospira soteropolitanensis]
MNDLAFENQSFLWGNEAGPIRILSEYLHPKAEFQEHGITDTIVVFGSARIPSPESQKKNPPSPLDAFSHYYEEAREFSRLITEWADVLKREIPDRNLHICTGGGPGIMEAGNRGAKEAGSKSVALNIVLPHEQQPNPYVNPELTFEFHYFFMRKLWFMKTCRGMIAFPGGFGTFDELFETLTLVQTGKKSRIPILLYGSKFWSEVINFKKLAEMRLIAEEDLQLFGFADSPVEALRFFQEKIRFELTHSEGTKT